MEEGPRRSGRAKPSGFLLRSDAPQDVQELPPRNGRGHFPHLIRQSPIVKLLVFSLQGRGDELDEAFSQGLVAWETVWAEPD